MNKILIMVMLIPVLACNENNYISSPQPYTPEQANKLIIHPKILLTAPGGVVDDGEQDPREDEYKQVTRQTTHRVVVMRGQYAIDLESVTLGELRPLFPLKPSESVNNDFNSMKMQIEEQIRLRKLQFTKDLENKCLKFQLKSLPRDLPEGAVLRQSLTVNDRGSLTELHVDISIAPQLLIQMILGEADGEMVKEFYETKGRNTVTNHTDQFLSPTAIALGYSAKNRVNAIMKGEFLRGYFSAKGNSFYPSVLTQNQYDGLKRQISKDAEFRSKLDTQNELIAYDLIQETISTLFYDGLIQENPLVAQRPGSTIANDRSYWFVTPSPKDWEIIDNTIANRKKGNGNDLKLSIYPIINIPTQIQFFYQIRDKAPNKSLSTERYQGFVFIRKMINKESELSILSYPDGYITGN